MSEADLNNNSANSAETYRVINELVQKLGHSIGDSFGVEWTRQGVDPDCPIRINLLIPLYTRSNELLEIEPFELV